MMEVRAFNHKGEFVTTSLPFLPTYVTVEVVSGDEVVKLYDETGKLVKKIDSNIHRMVYQFESVYTLRTNSSKSLDDFLRWQGMGVTYVKNMVELRKTVFSGYRGE